MILRNDDISADTDLEFFGQFCRIFDKYKLGQIHGVVVRGRISPLLSYGDSLENSKIRSLSGYEKIDENEELIKFLRSRNDDIALHGYYHIRYDRLNYKEQLAHLIEGKDDLEHIFSNKVNFFIAPYNKFNQSTISVCNQLGLKLLADEGVHLEWSLGREPKEEWHDKCLRYHWHRFRNSNKRKKLELILAKLKPMQYPLVIDKVNARKRQYKYKFILVKEIRVGRVLDVGCNSGWTMEMLQEKGCQVEGVDVCPALEVAREKGLKVKFAFADNLPYSSDSFDSVLLSSVLEETLSPKEVIKEALRVLKPRGCIIGINPSENSRWGVKGLKLNPYVLSFTSRKNFDETENIDDECYLFKIYKVS